MNCRASDRTVQITPNLQRDIERIDQLWTNLRQKYATEGDWLLGRFSIADCMFAPVAFRFNAYKINISDTSREYMQQVLSHPKVQLWKSQAQAETEVIEEAEVGK